MASPMKAVGLPHLFPNSQTTSPFRVTSKTRPVSASVMRVLPLGRRWHHDMRLLKKGFSS